MNVRPVIFLRNAVESIPEFAYRIICLIAWRNKFVVEVPFMYRRGNQIDFDVWF